MSLFKFLIALLLFTYEYIGDSILTDCVNIVQSVRSGNSKHYTNSGHLRRIFSVFSVVISTIYDGNFLS